jgi:hypothetical protein
MANGSSTNNGPVSRLDQLKKIADIIGPILMPLAVLWVGQHYTAKQATLEKRRLQQEDKVEEQRLQQQHYDDVSRSDFDRMRLIVDKLYSTTESAPRVAAVNCILFLDRQMRRTGGFHTPASAGR